MHCVIMNYCLLVVCKYKKVAPQIFKLNRRKTTSAQKNLNNERLVSNWVFVDVMKLPFNEKGKWYPKS